MSISRRSPGFNHGFYRRVRKIIMKRLKLMTVVGTRPEMIRLSEIIRKADRYFQHVFVHTGQNWDKNLKDIFYKDLNLREPDYYLQVAGSSPGETIGNIISKSYEVMQKVIEKEVSDE